MKTTTRDDAERSAFRIEVDGQPAGRIDYRRSEGVLTLVHTEVDDRYEGKGVAAAAVRQVLDGARADGLHIVPLCPYVRAWIGRHPDYADLVVEPA